MKTLREDVDDIIETLKNIKIENIKMMQDLEKQKNTTIILGICLFFSFFLIFILFLV